MMDGCWQPDYVPRIRQVVQNLSLLAPILANIAPREPAIISGIHFSFPHKPPVTPELLVAELPVLEGGVEQRTSPIVFHYNPSKPLAKVKSFHKRAPRVHMSARSLLRKLADSAKVEAWDRLHGNTKYEYEASKRNFQCMARDWLYYSAPNVSDAVRVAREHIDVASLEAAALALGEV